ncbi:MAG: response regulator [Spirochaetia bacterium]|nr:response regulator [Spirochaetia bacterium]
MNDSNTINEQTQIELLKQSVQELEKENKKNRRENKRLNDLLSLEKAVASARTNKHAVLTMEQQNRDKYMKLILENGQDMVLIFDNTGRVAYCTNVFLTTANIDNVNQVYGRTFHEIFNRLAAPELVNRIFETLKKSMRLKTPLLSSDTMDFGGRTRHYVLQINPLFDTAGKNEGGILLFHDITEIIEARKEAERASLAKSDFLSSMSHEMRTPMNAIIGMTTLAKLSDDIEKKDYCLSKIEDASNHLLGVINDILDMSKIEANKLELSHIAFNFEKMLQRVVNVINFKVDEKKQIFTVNIDRNIPLNLIGDDQRLTQVITNLLSNAVKFTPEEGSIDLSSSLLAKKDGIYTIQIAVKDSGIGISKEQQIRLFKSFQQAESGTTRKFGGTGLGLAISKRIVEMMDGEIWVESELGQGSAFIFTAKLKRGERRKDLNMLDPGVNWSNIRILAVDDTEDIRKYFEAVSQRFGIICNTAESGEEALMMIKKNRYDIYFIDWKMPGMDGIETTGRIKEYLRNSTDSGSKSVVIMISAADWNSIEDKAKGAGVDKFIPKPLFPSVIADCLNECLGTQGLPRKEAQSRTEDFKDLRILLAEDVEINREILISILEPANLSIDCAENGIEAFNMFSAAPGKYSLIFMDVQMPEMDGYEATKRIRAMNIPRAKTIPIIAMTANVFREDIERCLASGMNGHVGKPLDVDDVFEKLKLFLEK